MATTEAADGTEIHHVDSRIVEGAHDATPVVLVHGTGHHPHLARPHDLLRRVPSLWA